MFDVLADKGVADIDAGPGHHMLDHDRVVKPFIGRHRAGAAGVQRGLDGDDLKAVLFRRRPLDDQRAVDVLAALHGQIEALFL